MKRKLLKMSVAALILGCITNAAEAQWNLTGNSNATATSLLGTTNSISLRLATKNTPRLVIDTLGRVGIGTTAPATQLMVKGAGTNPSAAWTNIGKPVFSGFGETNVGNADFILGLAGVSAGLNPAPRFVGRRSRGTLAVPTAVANGDLLMSFSAFGFDGSAFQNPAEVGFYVDGTQSGTAVPTAITMGTGNNGASRVERMRIASNGDVTMNTNQFFLQRSSGNLGLGTLTPTARLEVAGQVKITGGTPGAGKVLTSDSSGLASWQTPSGGGGGWTAIGNNISNSNSGNVGIGTTSPQMKLTVAYNNGNLNEIATSGTVDPTTGSRLNYGDVGLDMGILNFGGSYIQNRSVSNLAIGYPLLLQPGGGNVSIGGKLPYDRLHVMGGALRISSGIAPNGFRFVQNAITGNLEIKYDIGTPYSEIMTLGFGGGVAIGTKTLATGYQLTVAGKIICTELKVQPPPFPDYVFDKKYNLRSIAEVEQHINEFHRLPGMPAASEVEKDGMSVGEMQTKLVEKVEELTLYIIAQQKQIDELKKLVKAGNK